MSNKAIDVSIGIVLGGLSIAIYLYAERYVGIGVNRYGPNFFPQALSVLLFIASVSLIIQALKGNALKKLESIDKDGFIRATITLVIAIAYVFSMDYLGFYAATGLFLFVTMKYLGQKNNIVTLLISAGVATIVYGIFKLFLKIPLPEGILF